MSAYWNNVLFLMGKRKVSQVELAQAIGKTKGTLNTWIKRDTVPPADYACKIAFFLNTSVEDLIEDRTIKPDPLILHVQKSPATRRIVEMLLPLPKNVIEAVRHGIAGILTSLGYKPGEKDEKGEPGSMVG